MKTTTRLPYVHGRFYPQTYEGVTQELRQHFIRAKENNAKQKHKQNIQPILSMVPHAGWMFSGTVCAQTLLRAHLAPNILLLGPKHTAFGHNLAVWQKGSWQIPGKDIPVHEPLAQKILAADSRLVADSKAHIKEHSLEVILPFLATLQNTVSIVPIALWAKEPQILIEIGTHIGQTLADFDEPVSIIVSSDMSHMLADAQTRKIDALAIEAALPLDPLHFYQTITSHKISMCGYVPMTVGLAAARVLGATRSELVAYATSADATGDTSQTVGYAGILVS